MSDQQPAPDASVHAAPCGAPPSPSVRQIISTAAADFGFELADLTGPDTRRDLVRARYAAIHAVRQAKPRFSLPQIGSAFGRDHTTVLYALRKMEREGVPQPPPDLTGATKGSAA